MHNTYTLTNGQDILQIHVTDDDILMMGSDAFWDNIDEVLVLIHADDPDAERGSAAILLHSEAPKSPMDEVLFGLGVRRGFSVGVAKVIATTPLMQAIEIAIHALNDIDDLLDNDNDNDNDNNKESDIVYH